MEFPPRSNSEILVGGRRFAAVANDKTPPKKAPAKKAPAKKPAAPAKKPAAKQGGKKTKNARANQEMDVTMSEMDTSFDENETGNSAFDDDEEAPAKGGSKGLSSVASSEKAKASQAREDRAKRTEFEEYLHERAMRRIMMVGAGAGFFGVLGVAFVVWLLYLGGLDANKTLLIGSIISGTLLFLGAVVLYFKIDFRDNEEIEAENANEAPT